MANFQETSNAKKGGLFVGKSHAEGGIPAVVTDTGRPIEVEGGEAIINKEATAKHWKELSKINQSAGNGVPIPPPYEFSEKINEKMERGGKLTLKEKSLIYTKWRRLINMTARELEKYYDSPDGKTSGLTQKEADKQGIDSGRESARMIVKMKRTRKDFWTNDMWRWAKKQISFVSRMRGVKGDLYDEKRKKTRKLKALLIWGHNPKKYRGSDSDFKEGGVAEKFFEDEVGHPFNKEDKKIDRPFTIRFHLGAGENFMKWKVENTDTKEVNFYQPDQYQIFMFDCKLVNSPKTAQKIFTGEINKTPIAWVQCARVEVMPISEQVIDIDKLSYNPQKAPNWVDVDGDILDNYVFPELVTFNRGVYYFEGEEVYEVGGLTYKEKFNKKYGFDPDESHSLKEVGKLTRIKEDSLEDIFDKGVGAFKTNPGSVRPSVKTPEQWAMGRVYSAVMGGKASKIDHKELERGRYDKGGLIAPNGKPSNLTPEQYKLVRTPAFKQWFGDWENSPETASKVVDENGEPLVVYHGSNNDFNKFSLEYTSTNTGNLGFLGLGFYFSTIKKDAKNYGKIVKPYFLNSLKKLDLRNIEYKQLAFLLPNLKMKNGKTWKEAFIEIDNIKSQINSIQIEDLKNNFFNVHYEYKGSWGMIPRRTIHEIEADKGLGVIIDRLIEDDPNNIGAIGNYFNPSTISKEIRAEGFDSIVSDGTNFFDLGDEIVVYEPNQIKLADGSNTTFDGNNPDIRYAEGGLTDNIFEYLKENGFKPLGNKLWEKSDCKLKIDFSNVLTLDEQNRVFLSPIEYNEYKKAFTILEIHCKEKGEGIGTIVLKEIIQGANLFKYTIFIEPTSIKKYSNETDITTQNLKEWYSKLGFKPINNNFLDSVWLKNPDISYAEGGLTEDYSEYLKYLEGEDLETMKSYISTFSDSKIEDGIKIEQAIKKLTRKYRTVVDDIVEIQTLEEKRKKVLDFIKDPANNTKLIIAFSGGKDSVAMVLRAIYEWKIPKTQIELWHHEVDGFGENLFDWKCTPSYCRAFAKEMGVPILFSYSDGGILKEMYRENDWRQPVYFQAKDGGEFIEVLPERKEDQRSTRRMFPAVGSNLETRWCSSVAKIEVMGKAITNNPEYKTANMVIMTGERREESGNRAKYNEIERYRNATKTRNAITWRSIIDMTESEIWDLYKQHKIQPHPCYELGWGRCSCQLCIFSEKDTWASINELTPSKVERIVEIEKDFGHTLYNEFDKIPFSPPQFYKEGDKAGQEKMKRGEKLANVYEAKVVKGKSFIPKDILQRWSKEALGEFVSPIIVEGEWKLPYGAFSQEQSGAN